MNCTCTSHFTCHLLCILQLAVMVVAVREQATSSSKYFATDGSLSDRSVGRSCSDLRACRMWLPLFFRSSASQ